MGGEEAEGHHPFGTHAAPPGVADYPSPVAVGLPLGPFLRQEHPYPVSTGGQGLYLPFYIGGEESQHIEYPHGAAISLRKAASLFITLTAENFSSMDRKSAGRLREEVFHWYSMFSRPRAISSALGSTV